MECHKKIQSLKENVESVFIGKPETVELITIALLANGHILVEDVPGVGKTTLAKALAKSVDCSFQRIQFTPDLLPADILGVSIFNSVKDEFVFKPGPIFTNVLLADEINRTTPRTQSSLLEAMNDFQVSVDGITHSLPKPFMVIATQNPYEYEGTYPLPESQLDRFLMKIKVGYPGKDDEKEVIRTQKIRHPLESLKPVVSYEDILEIQDVVRNVRVDESLVEYLLEIIEMTRKSEKLDVGASPRGTLSLFRSAQAKAVLENRDYCVPDDIKELTVHVISHRVIRRSTLGEHYSSSNQDVIREILDEVPVPL